MTRLEKDLVALPTLSSVQLAERWQELAGGEAPSVPASLLRRLLAQRLQEKRYGAVPLMVVRELERSMSTSTRASTGEPQRRDLVLTPGTRLIREWNGRTIAVEVTGEGSFLWNDQCYRSLSEIARTVTGAHWSGPRFFGLKSRG